MVGSNKVVVVVVVVILMSIFLGFTRLSRISRYQPHHGCLQTSSEGNMTFIAKSLQFSHRRAEKLVENAMLSYL